MSKIKFPMTVKRGNVRVKIYSTPTNGCDSFTVAYYFAGKRQRRTFADLELAKQEAEIAATKICAGELDVLSLTSADRTSYVRSLEMLKPLGTPLEMAVMQFVEAAKLLSGASLVEAAKFYTKHHSKTVVPRRVPEIVEEMLAAKTAEGQSFIHLRSLKSRLQHFAKAFPAPISMVLAPEIQDYIAALKTQPTKSKKSWKFIPKPLSGVSKNNARRVILNLFNYAQSRGYLPKGLTEAADLKPFKTVPTAIGIFTPEKMAKLLQHADGDLIPFLAIGAFAGLRSAEILRLDWSEVDLAGGHIEVKAQKAKTASRRLVPISDNLKKWLTPLHQGEGKVAPCEQMNNRIRDLTKASGVEWEHNGLRHSFISYRVAQIQNVAQVALEAGNSPKVIFSNYRELVKPAAAVKWFAIEPETPANVMPAPMAIAASA